METIAAPTAWRDVVATPTTRRPPMSLARQHSAPASNRSTCNWRSAIVNGKPAPTPAAMPVPVPAPSLSSSSPSLPGAVDTRPSSPLVPRDHSSVHHASPLSRLGSLDRCKEAAAPRDNHRWRLSPTKRSLSSPVSTASTASSSSGPGSPVPASLDARKCGDKRDFFFRHLDYDTRSRLRIDDVAAFSVTEVEMAKKISSVIVELVQDTVPMTGKGKCPITVTDGTACVGGNVLSFCDYFLNVNAVENDPTRFAMLEHNLGVLGKTNATCLHANYLNVMRQLDQLVVFMDPPWGGVDYKDQERVDLFLADVPLYTICERLKHRAQWIVLKVPSNFDDDKFARNVTGHVTVRQDFRKMHLVIVDNRESHGK